jgi:hypothetical protein
MAFNYEIATDDQLLAREDVNGGDLLSPHWIREKGLQADRPGVSPYAARDIEHRAGEGEHEETMRAVVAAREGRDKMQADLITPTADALSEQNGVTQRTVADLRAGRITIADAARVLEQHRAEVQRIEVLMESWQSLDATYQEIAEDPTGWLEGLYRRYPALAQHRRGL